MTTGSTTPSLEGDGRRLDHELFEKATSRRLASAYRSDGVAIVGPARGRTDGLISELAALAREQAHVGGAPPAAATDVRLQAFASLLAGGECFLESVEVRVVGTRLHGERENFEQADEDSGVDILVPAGARDGGRVTYLPGSHRWGYVGGSADGLLDLIDTGTAQTLELGQDDLVAIHPALAYNLTSAAGSQRLAILHYRSTDSIAERASANTDASAQRLGGGPTPQMRRGEYASYYEKRHLVVGRVVRERAEVAGIQLIDVGTDYRYPFFDSYQPTQNALSELASSREMLRHYPSSFGLAELRREVERFMWRVFGVTVDPMREIMINTGASQAFDALSRSLAGEWVLLPDLCLPTVASIATGNGARLQRVPLREANGLMDLGVLDRILTGIHHRGESVRFLYLNSPCNPSGKVAPVAYLEELVQIASAHACLVLHDMDAWYTKHTPEKTPNILEIPGSATCAVSVLSISKELGLPGARVGFMAGNAEIIDRVRAHNSLFCVMIPEVCQRAAYAALRSFEADDGRHVVSGAISELVDRSVTGWKELGWPDEAIVTPDAGFKFLVRVPPQIAAAGGYSAAELFDFYVATRAFIKVSTSLSFNPRNPNFIRMVAMQELGVVDQLFERLSLCGVHWDMTLPTGLAEEFDLLISENMHGDF